MAYSNWQSKISKITFEDSKPLQIIFQSLFPKKVPLKYPNKIPQNSFRPENL